MAPRPDGGSPRRIGPRLQALLLFLFAVLLYANTVSFRYTHDDALVITGNRFTLQGVGGIRDILLHDSFAGYRSERQRYIPGGRYRPLPQVWFAIEYELFGKQPLVGHLANVLLYGLLAAFLFFTLRRLFKQPDGDERLLSLPFVATALFVAHPLHTEVVANIKGRDEIMSLFGSLAALWFILNYVERRRVRHLVLGAAMFLLALLSKENAITFLAVVPLTLYVRGARGKDHLAALAALGAGLAVYLAVFRHPALGYLVSAAVPDRELLNNPFLYATAAQRYATVLLTWLIYLKLLLFPHPLTHDYYPKQIPIVGWGDLRALLSVAVFCGLTLFALLRIRSRSIVAYGILFSLLTFSVQSNLVLDVGTFMNERFMFAPSLGFCLVAAWFITREPPAGARRSGWRTAAAALFLVVLSGYAAKTLLRTPAWRDDFTLFTTDAEISTNSAKSAVNAGELWLGKALQQRDPAVREALLNKAVAYLKKGVELHPRRAAGWLLLGDAHRHRGDCALSRAAYERCLRENPGNLTALANLLLLGQACSDDGQR